MIILIVIMAVTLVVAGLVVAFAAYPHRGEPMPGVPWLGEVMERAADAVPTLEDGDLDRSQQRAGSHRT